MLSSDPSLEDVQLSLGRCDPQQLPIGIECLLRIAELLRVGNAGQEAKRLASDQIAWSGHHLTGTRGLRLPNLLQACESLDRTKADRIGN